MVSGEVANPRTYLCTDLRDGSGGTGLRVANIAYFYVLPVTRPPTPPPSQRTRLANSGRAGGTFVAIASSCQPSRPERLDPRSSRIPTPWPAMAFPGFLGHSIAL